MEKYQEALARAKNSLKVADHMVFVTYKLVSDSKLLLAIAENIFLTFTNSMAAILYYDRYYKRIPPFHGNFDSKFNMFREKIIKRYKIDDEYLKSMQEIKELIIEHQKSPIEFRKKEKFVICSEEYKIRTVTIDMMKDYVAKAKEFFLIIERIIKRQEESNKRFY